MKTAAFITASSLLLSSFVAAAPLNKKREVVIVTEYAEVVETVAITTTIWVDAAHVAEATTTAGGQFYQAHPHHSKSSSKPAPVPAVTSSSSVYTPAPYVAPSSSSSVYTPAPYVAPSSSSLSSSSVYVAPITPAYTPAPAPSTTETPTSIYTPAPVPESSQAPSSSAAAPAYSASAAPSSSNVYNGDITYYDVGMGSCGHTSTADQSIVAIPHGMMNNGANPNANPLCGQTITISYNGAKHIATIVDTCMGCDGAAIDLSTSLFQAVAPSGDGRVHGVDWWFNN